MKLFISISIIFFLLLFIKCNFQVKTELTSSSSTTSTSEPEKEIKISKKELQQIPNQYRQYCTDYYGTTQYEGKEINNGTMSLKAIRSGCFTLGCKVDNQNYDVLFGHPNNSGPDFIFSSYAYLNIDGSCYRFDISQSNITRKLNDSILKTERIINDIKVTQYLSFYYLNDNNEIKDKQSLIENGQTALIRFAFTNNSEKDHSIGLRMLFDTWGDSNDGVPFISPIDHSNLINISRFIITEQEFSGLDSFYVQALNPKGSHYIIKNDFTLSKATIPDRFIICRWPNAYSNTKWMYNYNPQEQITNDSGLLIYYDPTLVNKNKNRVINIYLGVNNMQKNSEYYIPNEIDDNNSYFVVSVYHLNETDFPMLFKAEVNKIDGIEKAEDETALVKELYIEPHDAKIIFFKLRCTGNVGERLINISKYINNKLKDSYSTSVKVKSSLLTFNARVDSDRSFFPVRYTLSNNELKDGEILEAELIDQNTDKKICTIELFDDGLHDDYQKNDHVYGNTFKSIPEGRYKLKIYATKE